ncbi:MAG: DUF4760 domain-containing protein [Marinospirillum sp.]|uniref:DUF4760 domain-containing protein n=1 Tax=Marinospirillum sp. TaxID=2183934 RepID=UPI0019E30B78|nr:DUF4760 domain-containing protein [Marinospirillum sp.]MBE0508877.1 DUF4760 domain-containing protein [Marinospirillum sp.]
MYTAIKSLAGWVSEHLVEFLVGFVILSLFVSVYSIWAGDSESINKESLLMPFVVAVGLFLAWIQYLSNKNTQRKEAALTYYPRPMELERIEMDIDRVINFWSSSDAMASHEVKLMLDEDITLTEYELCWERLSNQVKRDIVDIYYKYYSSKSLHHKEKTLSKMDYKKYYSPLIKEQFIDVRRKFHLYLNQIEGFCLALNKGNIDSSTAKEMYVHKLGNHFRKAKPYIDAVRAKKNAPDIYIQFEKVIKKWQAY